MNKIKGIKKSVGDFNKWKGQARIYFAKGERKVWTNVYPSGNESWDDYHDKNIVEVHSKFGLDEQDDKITMKSLIEKIEQMLFQDFLKIDRIAMFLDEAFGWDLIGREKEGSLILVFEDEAGDRSHIHENELKNVALEMWEDAKANDLSSEIVEDMEEEYVSAIKAN